MIHVDDILLTSTKMFLKWIEDGLITEFKMSKVSFLHHCLSFDIKRERGWFHLLQKTYIEEVGEKFKIEKGNHACPLPQDVSFADPEGEKSDKPSRKLIGHFQCIANGTRPDIQSATNKLAAFVNNPMGKQ